MGKKGEIHKSKGIRFVILTSILLIAIVSPALAVDYNRQSAVNYAITYAYTLNPCQVTYAPPVSGGDCTHFVSHSLEAGGLSNRGTQYATNWLENPGYIVSVSKLRRWFQETGIATRVSSINQLEPGDVVITSDRTHAVLYLGTYNGKNYRVASHTDDGIFSYAAFTGPYEYWHINVGRDENLESYTSLGQYPLSDKEKQTQIKNIVDKYREEVPLELILSLIRQEGGEGAFRVNGWQYNPFYSKNNAPWAQPNNGDGIMQVTPQNDYHEESGQYTHTKNGYEYAIHDGCDNLLYNYRYFKTLAPAVLHYNTGPNSLYIYLGKSWGDRNYLSKVASCFGFIETTYGVSNPSLVAQLNQGQSILNQYLYEKGLKTGQNVQYYATYQKQLDTDLAKISGSYLSPTSVPTPSTVRLTLYMHDSTTSGAALSGVSVTSIDSKGKTVYLTTDGSGAVTIDGVPGTWQFAASRSGYQTNSWTNEITTSQVRHGYLIKVATPTPTPTPVPTPSTVRLTLYMHDSTTHGAALSGVSVTSIDSKGKTVYLTTDGSGAVTIDGVPGTWQFTASRSGYQSVTWSNSITYNQIRHGYLMRL